MKMTKRAFFILVIILIFSSCFSDWKGDKATLTISFGGSNGRAAAWPPTESGILGEIEYTVTLSSGSTKLEPIKKNGTETITVEIDPGLWKVEIEARIGDLPFAAGSNSKDVIAGQNNHVDVPMKEKNEFTFFAVDSSTEWENVMKLISGYEDPPTGKHCVIIVTKDFPANNLTPSASNITICGNHTITLTGTGSLLNVYTSRNVTLRDVKLKGMGIESDNTAPLVLVEGGSFTMKGSASITGNNNNGGNGGGVIVYNGKFTMMDNAVISGNTATGKLVDESSSSWLGGNGGGVYVNNGEFTMLGNASVSNNKYVSPSGGGFSKGGGVCVNGGIFIMNGGTISGNKFEVGGNYSGGGVYIEGGGTFTMTGGTIGGDNAADANKAAHGSGVFVFDGTFTMDDGEVSGNIVGDGVYIYENINNIFNMNGGKISGNIKTDDVGGGGVSFNGGTFNMTGGTISGNKTNGNGGGVYVDGGTFTMTGGTISGNTVSGNGDDSGWGGGVYVESGTFRIVTGTVYGSENTIDASLRNNATTNGAALYKVPNGVAQYGTDSNWTSFSDSTIDAYSENATIEVVDGEKKSP